MSKNIKAIGFDWSGVVFFHATKYREIGAKFLHITEEEFTSAYFKHNHLHNLSSVSLLDFWRVVFAELGREAETVDFLHMLSNLPIGTLNHELLQLLEEVKQAGYKVGLFSNNSVDGAKEARSFGVDKLFPVALFSAEVGVMKPQAEAFHLLAEKLGVDITEMIFIDDTQKSLEKASEAGYTSILYQDVKTLYQDLEKVGISLASRRTPQP